MIPDPTTLVVYGVPIVGVIAVLVALFRKYFPDTGDWDKWITACLTVVGYLLVTNLPALEELAPSVKNWLPQVLTAVLLFGASLGLVPGETANKVKNRILRKG